MDWKYILTLSPENLTEEEKDELYNKIAWLDYDMEKLDHKRYVALLKISQEIMKFKSEQVEALVAELDEVAARQGEEEARKQGSLDDLLSLKSKKSQSSIDYEDLEQKYKETKGKLKQQIKLSESQKLDIKKMKENISTLHQEKLHMQSELQSMLSHGDESQSDASESVAADQHKELVQLVQQKNKQISHLLNDIEVIENENFNLKEQLGNLRDEIQDATNQLSVMTDELTAAKIKLNDNLEIIQCLNEENEALRNQIKDCSEEKQQRDKEIDEFTAAIDKRVDDWKKLLEEKNATIDKLQMQVKQSSLHSSQTSLSLDNDKGYIETLNKIIIERDEQLVHLQSQLQCATKEMDECAQSLQQLKLEKNSAYKRIDELSNHIINLKSQLQAAHERCQSFQEDISYVENMAESKQEEYNEVLATLKGDGNIALAEALEQTQKLKSQLRIKDKQILEYVRFTNKLQSSVEHIENENTALRDKCGIADDEDINITGVLIKKRKQSKESEQLLKQIRGLEDEKLNLRGDIQKLNRRLSVLSSQILDSGGKINIDNELVAEGHKFEHTEELKMKYRELLEENEALRKGLHEILENLQTKNESNKREIKSETLEKLLRALDVRHVSGWYHPAMRLQAELHTLQGVNIELREQLRLARSRTIAESSKNYQQEVSRTKPKLSLEYSQDPNHNNLPLSKEEDGGKSNLIEHLEEYRKNLEMNEEQLNLTHVQLANEKRLWEDKETKCEAEKRELEDHIAILDGKLDEFLKMDEEEYKKVERFAEMSGNLVKLNRKCVYLENNEAKSCLELKKLKNDLVNAQTVTFEKMSLLRNEKTVIFAKLINLENLHKNSVNKNTLIAIQNHFDGLTLKYRSLLSDFNTIKTDYSNELVILNENAKACEEQKRKLQNKLLEVLHQLHTIEVKTTHENNTELSKKLAQIEVNELTEKQRANHMSNLYRVVKEQLQKSEENLAELEKSNQEIARKNLTFQEQLKDMENKILNYIDVKQHEALELELTKSLEQMEKLTCHNGNLKEELAIAKKSLAQAQSTSSSDLEVLSLKHQILDLQASSDDKALIARLSSDLILARLSETECHKKLEELGMDLKEWQYNFDTSKSKYQQEKLEKDNTIAQLQAKISELEEIIRHQREQYLGSIPLISEEVFNTNLQNVLKDKMLIFSSLENIRKEESECVLLKQQLNKQIDLEKEFKACCEDTVENTMKKIKKWHQERNAILIKELKYQRELDFKTSQLEQLSARLNTQDELITKLQEEILKCYKFESMSSITNETESTDEPEVEIHQKERTGKTAGLDVKLLKQQETQTTPELLNTLSDDGNVSALINNLQTQLNASTDDVKKKNNVIEQLKSKIAEMEMNISLFRTQIGDKQSQITFYEKHILELQNKVSKMYSEPIRTDYAISNVVPANTEELLLLKDAINKLQETNLQKDSSILKYQTLLKKDRDEHSLAAARMQDELKRLQDLIAAQEKAYKELQESSVQHPGRAAIEQYILQVHALEKHTSELHTTVSTLNSQLQTSRQEAVRWQSLANERLDSIEQLRNDIEEQHQQEIATYKRDSERWREEILKLKELISKHRSDANYTEPDINRRLQEKDDKIYELTMALKQVKNEAKKHSEKADALISPKLSELESVKEQMLKEHENLKKRYEQVLGRERNAKEEIHNLKEQLLKRPISSARSDKTEKEQNLQKKITQLDKEVEELKSKLDKQLVINEAHKVAVEEDFEKWKKQKYWQQTAEKMKSKLQEKTEECEKIHQTCAGYKILIERLEREKHSLENRIKVLRNAQPEIDSSRLDMVQLENDKLHYEVEALSAKLQMQQHHSGGLGASMLQEKLEAQERKIAFLELTSKGSGEMRGELERLQNTNENLLKLNLRLEAENLELKLDLEKCGNDAPHLREQIQYLENYIDVLKSENEANHLVTESGDQITRKNDKKVAELERTVFVLKRVVEKLQVENKRLQGGGIKACSLPDRVGPGDKLRVDFLRLKELFSDATQKVSLLEDKLKLANNKIALLEKRPVPDDIVLMSEELSRVRSDLAYKSELLEKVKVLLQRAATKEKVLLEEISLLKSKIPSERSAK